MKLLEENIAKTLLAIDHNNIFLDLSPSVMKIKTKINTWDLIKLKSFCTGKETIKFKDSLWNERKVESYIKTNKKLEHPITTYKKINSKWIKDLNGSSDTVKLRGKHVQNTDINCSKFFWIRLLE